MQIHNTNCSSNIAQGWQCHWPFKHWPLFCIFRGSSVIAKRSIKGAFIQNPPNEIHCSKPFSRIPVLQSVINSGLISSLPYYKSGQCLTDSTGSVSHCAPSQIWNIIADNTFPYLWAGPDLTQDPTREIGPMSLSLGRWLSLSGSLLIWIETSVSNESQ